MVSEEGQARRQSTNDEWREKNSCWNAEHREHKNLATNMRKHGGIYTHEGGETPEIQTRRK